VPPAPEVIVHHGDCLNVLRGLPDNSVHAVVTDPPYNLSFMSKNWDTHANARAFQDWCKQWAAECLRVLRPGGHLLAFGGTRTFHRLTCGIEDAGFEIRDSIAWLHAQGFAKGRDFPRLDYAANGDDEAAERWAGWNVALKPAFEPIVVARKPLQGTVAANVQEWGTGALNIDATRVGSEVRNRTPSNQGSMRLDGCSSLDELRALAEGGQKTPSGRDARTTLARAEAFNATAMPRAYAGRWPANVALDTTQARELDQQSGQLTSGATKSHRRAAGSDPMFCYATRDLTYSAPSDTGGASRFFSTFPDDDPLPTFNGRSAENGQAPLPHEGGPWPTMKYQAKAPTRERPSYTKDDGTKVAHPTVKSLALMRWLVRLVTPPGGTVLEPFAGSGATVEACILEGFGCIAVEREADYLPLIEQRVERARAVVAARDAVPPVSQLGLFDGDGDVA
jgi:DNA modification methylase